jgi:hypothetical protein
MIKLMHYDNNVCDVMSAAMYFNTMSSHQTLDSFADRIGQAMALLDLFKEILRLTPRPEATKVKGTRTKRTPTADNFQNTDVVEWLAERAQLLEDGAQFTKNADDNVTIGVIIRVARVMPKEIYEWFQDFAIQQTYSQKTMNAVVSQPTLSSAIIWADVKKTPRSVCTSFV